MDKRFLLALVLTAVVVIATPLIFRTPSSPVKEAATPLSARTSETPRNRVPPPSIVETPARDTSLASTPAIRSDSVVSAAAVAETTIVATPVAEYQLSTMGAIPLSVELKSYRALDGSNQNVRLASASGRLLAYRLYLPGDTIDLSRIPFSPRASRSNAR